MSTGTASHRQSCREAALLLLLFAGLTTQAQLFVTVSPPKVVGPKAIVPLALKNGLPEPVASARAVMFLLDEQGKVIGHATQWIIGGDTNRPALAVGSTNSYHFVIPTAGKAFVTNRLTITQVKLSSGRTANPVTDVEVRFSPKL